MAERVLVCGSRDWTDYPTIRRTLEKLNVDDGVERVVHGDCEGADEIAKDVCVLIGIPVIGYPALWGHYFRAAGPIRNQFMLDDAKPTMVLAFHDDIEASKGTKDMVGRARKAGVPVRIITTHDVEGT